MLFNTEQPPGPFPQNPKHSPRSNCLPAILSPLPQLLAPRPGEPRRECAFTVSIQGSWGRPMAKLAVARRGRKGGRSEVTAWGPNPDPPSPSTLSRTSFNTTWLLLPNLVGQFTFWFVFMMYHWHPEWPPSPFSSEPFLTATTLQWKEIA